MNQKDGEIEEFIEYVEEGEALVIRRSLNVIQENEEAWLLDNIFQTKCTSHGKVCNAIIDSGTVEVVLMWWLKRWLLS